MYRMILSSCLAWGCSAPRPPTLDSPLNRSLPEIHQEKITQFQFVKLRVQSPFCQWNMQQNITSNLAITEGIHVSKMASFPVAYLLILTWLVDSPH